MLTVLMPVKRSKSNAPLVRVSREIYEQLEELEFKYKVHTFAEVIEILLKETKDKEKKE